MDDKSLIQVAKARDEILDQWISVCTPQDRDLTARWLTLGEETDIIPRPLRAAQGRVVEAIREMEEGSAQNQ